MSKSAEIISEYSSLATLFDALSVAFSYPTTAFYDALCNNDFYHVITENVELLSWSELFADHLIAVNQGIAATIAENSLETLGSTYIGLFEMNQNEPVLHLYGHLYNAIETNRIQRMQQLQAIYHRYGIELDPNIVADQPDHLAIELEFLAFLLQSRSQITFGKTDAAVVSLETDIRLFLQELKWVKPFVDLLLKRRSQAVYCALAELLVALVEASAERV